MINIDISTEEKKSELYKLFESFNKIGDIYNYYKIYDNSKNIQYIREIAEKIGFDLNSYKLKRAREKKYCMNCGKELNSEQYKFCSNSCSATYNNKLRGPMSDETKSKIRNSLKKLYPNSKTKTKTKTKTDKVEVYKHNHHKEPRSCIICGNIINSKYTSTKTCSPKCYSILMNNIAAEKHKESYIYYLNHEDEFCRPNYIPKQFKPEFIEEQGGVCAICGCKPEWNGKPLVFVLDHIDGDASNNKRENLRCVCPNCDSQLDTFKSKNKNSTRRNYWREKIIREMQK